jgi:hypothetical protein
VLQGYTSGAIKIVSSNELLKESLRPGEVNCACTVAGTVWIGVDRSIYKATFWGGGLSVSPVADSVHDRDMIVHMLNAGEGEVWCSTLRGDVSVWDTSTGQRKQAFTLGNGIRLHSMCAVEMYGAPTVWMGCDDEVRVFNCATR